MTKTKTVLILGNDQHAWAMHYFLLGKGQPSYVLDSRSDWKMISNDDRELSLLTPAGKILYHETIQSVYWRSHDGVAVPEGASEFALHNRASIFDSFLKGLKKQETLMYNYYDCWQLHKTKPFQDLLIDEILASTKVYTFKNLAQPSTKYLSLDNIDDTYAFGLVGNAVKGAQGGIHAISFGSAIWPRDVYSAFQRLINGQTYRVYSFHSHTSVVYSVDADTFDYRADPDVHVSESELPREVCDELRAMHTILGFNWAGIDVIHSEEDGKYYVLDVNPSPMFIGFDGGQKVFRALSCELMEDWSIDS